MTEPHGLPSSIVDGSIRIRRVSFGGNPTVGAPHVYGWSFKLGRHTTEEERMWLREHGWEFSGGKWYKRDS